MPVEIKCFLAIIAAVVITFWFSFNSLTMGARDAMHDCEKDPSCTILPANN